MSQQRTCGKPAISPDEGVLRLGRRLLALASSWRADLGFALLETISLDEGDLRLSGEPENLFSFVNPSKDD